MNEQKPIMNNDEFLKTLPEFMRDFHDEKDLFKAIHQLYGSNTENKIPIGWVDAHVYTIDFFLWFMAVHGYRLTKFKSKKFQQYNIDDTIENSRKARTEILRQALTSSTIALSKE